MSSIVINFFIYNLLSSVFVYNNHHLEKNQAYYDSFIVLQKFRMMALLVNVLQELDIGQHGMTEMTGLVLVTGRSEICTNQKEHVQIIN